MINNESFTKGKMNALRIEPPSSNFIIRRSIAYTTRPIVRLWWYKAIPIEIVFQHRTEINNEIFATPSRLLWELNHHHHTSQSIA
jgi:hypothetical protein